MPYKAEHKNPKGPGDGRPTAADIIRDEGLLGKLTGKTILITGGSSGLGLEAARALQTTGAKVFITSREEAKGRKAVESISTTEGVPIDVIGMELDSFDSIRSGVSDFLHKARGLDVLICNGGVMMCPEGRTKDGFETQFGVNYLSHFLLFQGGQVRLNDYNFDKEKYDAGQAYGQSKTAEIYLASEIERRCGGEGIHGFSVHPGLIQTPLLRHIKDDPMGQGFINTPEAKGLWKSPEQGAATEVWAAVGHGLNDLGGKYLEDCGEAKPFDPKSKIPGHAPGYAPYAYDSDAAKKLWEDSLAMTAQT
ncbi:Retinol dehydrogenase 11 [Cyphellophora attinorum]|uniref:Retinol dehydrogenase 11 n=1 Tax=Cyphellophora attinorum TaxID=1664694 RepID=A0A0N1H193_9EURO|nr:Retinol dehydrogenase 11 [Phialophora attinorum]KPI38035.1 Retinol dehydrogenase 11 [Phialophora attinorum]